jgi:hypothetical protein
MKALQLTTPWRPKRSSFQRKSREAEEISAEIRCPDDKEVVCETLRSRGKNWKVALTDKSKMNKRKDHSHGKNIYSNTNLELQATYVTEADFFKCNKNSI